MDIRSPFLSFTLLRSTLVFVSPIEGLEGKYYVPKKCWAGFMGNDCGCIGSEIFDSSVLYEFSTKLSALPGRICCFSNISLINIEVTVRFHRDFDGRWRIGHVLISLRTSPEYPSSDDSQLPECTLHKDRFIRVKNIF